VPEAHVNGVRLCYDERGSGAPILCIHGAGTSAQLWADAVEKLAQLGRAIAYDRRGYGRSERPEPCHRVNVAEHTDDAAALLDALEATPAVVVARSYGGEVASAVALRYPDRVRALVLLEAAAVELLPPSANWTRGFRDCLRDVAAQFGEGGDRRGADPRAWGARAPGAGFRTRFGGSSRKTGQRFSLTWTASGSRPTPPRSRRSTSPCC
jgi:esterase